MSDRTCPFPSCDKPLHSRGYCSSHAAQLRQGIPLRPIRHQGRPLSDRFWEKVRKTESCWLWVGSTNHLGYGQIWLVGEKSLEMAHRVSLTLAGVEIPKGYDVDHLCRVRNCVNPAHLEPVTHAENMDRAPWTAIEFQASKTHCKHGHEFTPENTYEKPNSSGGISRECRACQRARHSRYRAARKNRPVNPLNIEETP